MGVFKKWFGSRHKHEPVHEPVPESDEDKAERLLRGVESAYSIDGRISAARELRVLGRPEVVERMLAVYREDLDGIDLKNALSEAIDALDPHARKKFEDKRTGLGDFDRETEDKVRQLYRNDLLDLDGALALAIDHVRSAGKHGSDTVAHLIEKLIDSRSRALIVALHVAKHANPTPELSATLRSIAFVPQTKEGRWPPGDPEIVGNDRYGWTDETFKRIRTMAVDALSPPEA